VTTGDPVDLTAYDAWLFDLDGVVTDTARVHAAAWKAAFDPVLEAEGTRTGVRQEPFDPVDDYLRFVDGRPRADGVRGFFAARGLELGEGSPGDPPGAHTVCGIADAKNELVRRVLATDGVAVYPGTLALLELLRSHEVRTAVVSASENTGAVLVRRVLATDGVAVYPGTLALLELLRSHEVRTAVVSASENTGAVLAAAAIGDLFDARVDGLVARELHLPGKPAPDTYVEAARVLGVPPSRAVVIEDALAGVAAGRSGGFGLVVGVDRVGQARALAEHGADVVVGDLAELLP